MLVQLDGGIVSEAGSAPGASSASFQIIHKSAGQIPSHNQSKTAGENKRSLPHVCLMHLSPFNCLEIDQLGAFATWLSFSGPPLSGIFTLYTARSPLFCAFSPLGAAQDFLQ